MSTIITISENIKSVWLGSSLMIHNFYNKCEHEISLSGTSGMLNSMFHPAAKAQREKN